MAAPRFFLGIRRDERAIVFLLFLNFYLIITSYYIVKSVRGALVIHGMGADALPYVWVVTVAVMIVLVGWYGKLVDRLPRQKLVLCSIVFFLVTLVAIRLGIMSGRPWISALFYVWSDIFSVVMVEQFWSFNNDVFAESDAKRLYGIIGSGGILGGMTGGAIVALIAPKVGTANMAFVCAGVLALLALLVVVIQNTVRSHETVTAKPAFPVNLSAPEPGFWEGFRLVGADSYLAMIAVALLLSQACATIIDFQFNKAIEAMLPGLDEKSAAMGGFFVVMNGFSFVMMSLVASPLIRRFGVIAGLGALPLADMLGVAVYFFLPLPAVIGATALADKSLNYSVNRAARELLYIPLSRAAKYKAKAVIDMLGFRLSQVFASALIIPLAAYALLPWLGALNAVLLIVLAGVNFRLARRQGELACKA